MVFFFKQKTAYEMRISDWSSDVCSSDLAVRAPSHGDPPVRSPRLLGWTGATIRADGRWPVEARPCDAGAAALECRERSEERRVGKECVSRCRTRWSLYHLKRKSHITHTTSKR